MRLCLFFLLFLVNTYAFIVSYNYNFPRRDTTVLFGKGSRKSNNKAKKKKTITNRTVWISKHTTQKKNAKYIDHAHSQNQSVARCPNAVNK